MNKDYFNKTRRMAAAAMTAVMLAVSGPAFAADAAEGTEQPGNQAEQAAPQEVVQENQNEAPAVPSGGENTSQTDQTNEQKDQTSPPPDTQPEGQTKKEESKEATPPQTAEQNDKAEKEDHKETALPQSTEQNDKAEKKDTKETAQPQTTEQNDKTNKKESKETTQPQSTEQNDKTEKKEGKETAQPQSTEQNDKAEKKDNKETSQSQTTEQNDKTEKKDNKASTQPQTTEQNDNTEKDEKDDAGKQEKKLAKFLENGGKIKAYIKHLSQHIGDGKEGCTVSDTVELLKDTGKKKTVIGRLTPEDTIKLNKIKGNMVKITVTDPSRDNREVQKDLTGWIKAEYVECGCYEKEMKPDDPVNNPADPAKETPADEAGTKPEKDTGNQEVLPGAAEGNPTAKGTDPDDEEIIRTGTDPSNSGLDGGNAGLTDEDANQIDGNTHLIDGDANLIEEYVDLSDEDSDPIDEDTDLTDEDSDPIDEDTDLTDEDSDPIDEDTDLIDEDENDDLIDEDYDPDDEYDGLDDEYDYPDDEDGGLDDEDDGLDDEDDGLIDEESELNGEDAEYGDEDYDWGGDYGWSGGDYGSDETAEETAEEAEEAAAVVDDEVWKEAYHQYLTGKAFKLRASLDAKTGRKYFLDQFGLPYYTDIEGDVEDLNYSVRFALYDWNKDGIPELFAYSGSREANGEYYAFTCKDGQVEYIGKVGYGTRFNLMPYRDDTHNVLFSESSDAGVSSVTVTSINEEGVAEAVTLATEGLKEEAAVPEGKEAAEEQIADAEKASDEGATVREPADPELYEIYKTNYQNNPVNVALLFMDAPTGLKMTDAWWEIFVSGAKNAYTGLGAEKEQMMAEETAPEEKTVTAEELLFTAATSKATNIRESADKTSTLISAIKAKGTRVSVFETLPGADGKIWYRIQTEDGTAGYARSDFFTKEA